MNSVDTGRIAVASVRDYITGQLNLWSRYRIGVSDIFRLSIGCAAYEDSYARTEGKKRYFDFLKRRRTRAGKRNFVFLIKEITKFIAI
jgi:hypothetical protein